jgi:hypothetical protein
MKRLHGDDPSTANTASGFYCRAKTKSGRPCRIPAQESGYCIWHDPNRKEEAAELRRKGGLARHGLDLNLNVVDRAILAASAVADEMERTGELPEATLWTPVERMKFLNHFATRLLRVKGNDIQASKAATGLALAADKIDESAFLRNEFRELKEIVISAESE